MAASPRCTAAHSTRRAGLGAASHLKHFTCACLRRSDTPTRAGNDLRGGGGGDRRRQVGLTAFREISPFTARLLVRSLQSARLFHPHRPDALAGQIEIEVMIRRDVPDEAGLSVEQGDRHVDFVPPSQAEMGFQSRARPVALIAEYDTRAQQSVGARLRDRYPRTTNSASRTPENRSRNQWFLRAPCKPVLM